MKNKVVIGCIVALVVFVIASCGIVGTGYFAVNNFRKGIVDSETQVSGTYKQCADQLSQRIEAFYEGLGIAKDKTGAIDKIVSDVIAQRGSLSQAALVQAITEAYPDLGSNLNIYDTVLEQVNAQRAAFHGCQQGLIDQLAAFQRKIHDDIIGQFAANLFNLPDENLVAQNGNGPALYGKDALAKMAELVVTSSTSGAYDTGHLDPLVAPTDAPANSKR